MDKENEVFDIDSWAIANGVDPKQLEELKNRRIFHCIKFISNTLKCPNDLSWDAKYITDINLYDAHNDKFCKNCDDFEQRMP